MGLAIVGLALTPSYRSIGIAAPIAVIAFRLLQGFAIGGEVGPSTSYLFESAPENRKGLYVSFQYFGQTVATLLAGVVGLTLTSFMGEASMRNVGWRIAMLVGAMIVPMGFALRRGLPETLPMDEPSAANKTESHQAPTLYVAILALVMISAGTTVSYILSYLVTYSTATLHMLPRAAFSALAIGGIVGIFIPLLGGWLSDRYGRRPVMIWPWVVLLIVIFPCFYAISYFRTAQALLGAILILGTAGGISAASIMISVTEIFPRKIRSTSIALVYALAISVFGGTTQFNVALLTRLTHSVLAPAWYMFIGVALGLIAMIAMKETSPAHTSTRIRTENQT
jgi:MFS transporter, MHS family, citrate/tricarballylate:H+ symporter